MRIPNRIPGILALRGGDGNLFVDEGVAYNYALAGIPFLSAASNLQGGQWWIRRETAPFRKQQFDSAQNPGEQSLEGYWTRSQMSFHAGEGQLYADPQEGTVSSDIRYWTGKNVNPWEPGRLTLLNDVDEILSLPTATELISVMYGVNPGVFGFNGTNVIAAQVDPVTGVVSGSQSVAGPGPTIYSCTTNGGRIILNCADGMYRSTIPNSAVGAFVWTKIYNYVATSRSEVAWVKDRIILGLGRDIYELTVDPAGIPAALPTALYTAQSQGWTWTSVTETTSAIYALGYVGSVSSILKFVLDSSGDAPTLTGGSVAAMLPGGETAQAIFGYLGTFLAIGTSKGLRIAISDSNGDLTYGPLLWEHDSPTAVVDFTARDHWIWCTYEDPDDSEYKVARVDLSMQIDTLRFPYATDLTSTDNADPCQTLAFFGNSPVIAFATTSNLHFETADRKAENGWLQTSRIRFNTLENKIFRYVRVRGPIQQGNLAVAYITSTGSVTPIYTYGQGQTPGNDDLKLVNTARDYLALEFTLTRGTPTSGGGELTGWQVKALPAVVRQRLITLPIWCFDYEEDKHGVRTGGQGTAFQRLAALEAIEQSGEIMTFQDLDNNVTYDVFVESLDFQQQVTPPHWNLPGSFGGRILITMRTV